MSILTLVLNEHGIPQQWATWQEAIIYKAKELVVWEMGKLDWTKFGGVNNISQNRSSITYSSIMAVRGSSHHRHRTPTLSNPNLFRRDLNICAYCGREFEAKSLTNDHIIPRSRGGEHSWMNCVSSCKRCNSRKDSKTPQEAGMELMYVPYVPCREEALILRNRNILGDQLEYLRAMVPKHSRVHFMDSSH